jgi:hypothetical protein
VPLRVQGGIRVPGKCIRYSEGRSFEEMSNMSALTVPGQMFGGIAVDLYLRLFWSNGVGLAI